MTKKLNFKGSKDKIKLEPSPYSDYFFKLPEYYDSCLEDIDPIVRSLGKKGRELLEKFHPELF